MSDARPCSLTAVASEQLLLGAVRLMVYRLLLALIMADIRDIAIVFTSEDLLNFERLLGDGSLFGARLS